MKTLKEKFINNKLQEGSIITTAFKMYESYATKDNEIVYGRYIKVRDVFYKLNDSQDIPYFIDIKDIRDDLSVFNPEYKDVYILKIDEPSDYDLKYYKPKKPRLTKREIENILGYEIEIVEE